MLKLNCGIVVQEVSQWQYNIACTMCNKRNFEITELIPLFLIFSCRTNFSLDLLFSFPTDIIVLAIWPDNLGNIPFYVTQHMKTSNRDWDRFLVSLDYLTSLSANDTISFLKCFSVNYHIKDKEMTAKPQTKILLVLKFGSKEKRSNLLKY